MEPPSTHPPSRMLWLIRHAETEWSRSGRHTGRTDLPLTPDGERMARDLASILRGRTFCKVWSSPRRRAMRTGELVGLGAAMEIDEDLAEWDYGLYEGLTSAEIERRRPGWNLWRHGCPEGESLEQVAARARRVLTRVRQALDGGERGAGADGANSAGAAHGAERNVAILSHGHFLRVLAASWLELPPSRGRSFGLHADSVSILGFEHGDPVIWSWDWTEHLLATGH